MLSSLKGASFAGMPLGKALSAKVRDEWGLNLFTYTSAGDTGTAWEGIEHDGYHLWEDTMFAETLDPVTGKAVGDNELGELISTDLDNAAAPYIRFRTGDLVRLNREPAPSGRTHARMWVLGRTGDEMSIANKAVLLSDVWEHVESIPEFSDAMFQVVYEEPSPRLRIRLGYSPELTADVDELRNRASGVLEQGLGVPIDAELINVDALLASSKSVAKFSRKVKA
jgi:phenylacetate-coenzyme A ligase PaaK-like adenylate-forming protein